MEHESESPAANHIHFHIRWRRTNRLDWEAFATSEEAKARASELAHPGEVFEIEGFDHLCVKCRVVAFSVAQERDFETL
jgi:hypothetical protein